MNHTQASSCNAQIQPNEKQANCVKDNKNSQGDIKEIQSESCKRELFSGISFSKFENMSDQSEYEDNSDLNDERKKPELKTYIMNKKSILKRIPSSNKILSSKQIKDQPMEIIQVPKKGVIFPSFQLTYEGDERLFEYKFSNEIELSHKIKQFVGKKQMECQLRENCIIAIHKAPFFSNILKICFPTSGLFADQVYQIQFDEKQGKIVKVSGQDQQYFKFKEELLTELWIKKCLVCKNLKQKIKYFLIYANQSLQRIGNEKKKVVKDKGIIDAIKINLEKVMKKGTDKFKKQQGNNCKQKNQVGVPQTRSWQILIIESLSDFISNLRDTEKTLKILLLEQLKKQQDIKVKTSKSIRKQSQEFNSLDKQKIQPQEQKLFITPVIEKILMDSFYEKLGLQQAVIKFCPFAKNFTNFEQKKMILKGSLSRVEIFKHIQLEQFRKTYQKSLKSNQEILTESIKILQTVKMDTYPFPPHIFNICSIYKSTLQKQINRLSKSEMKVKFQDHSNEEQTFLQLSIYCVLMCQNRSLYSTILTCLIFQKLEDGNSQLMGFESAGILNTLKKAIQFIERDWIL